jgi:hypothetical protein
MNFFTREDRDNLYLKENKSWTKIVKLLQGEDASKKNQHFKSFERVFNEAKNDYYSEWNAALRNLKESPRVESNAYGNI